MPHLVEDMRIGKVSTLLIMDSNPAYAAPGALGFAEALKRVDFSLSFAPPAGQTRTRADLSSITLSRSASAGSRTIRKISSWSLEMRSWRRKPWRLACRAWCARGD